MIILIGGTKGGTGKTTIATHLAIMRAAEGKDLLLVDADDQETASDFSLLRNENMDGSAGFTCVKLTGKAVRTEVNRQIDKYDDIVIDCGGRDTTSLRAAITVADLVLVPFIPRSFDIWTIDKVSDLIEDGQAALNPELKAYTFLNRTDPRGSDNKDAADILRENTIMGFLDAPIVNRKAFGNAAADGLAVTELRAKDVKAIGEIGALYGKVFQG
jgi:chromosome partitioning protein